MSSAHICT